MTASIDAVTAWEVLDSRGTPTVRVAVECGDRRGTFTVPSGASTGTHEAHERRDDDERFDGKGVRKAIAAVNDELGPAVVGHDVTDRSGLDATLVEADGTETLHRYGANAILGVSGAALHAASAVLDRQLYAYLADGSAPTLPVPMVNVLSGGLHARGGFEVQDVLVVPVDASRFRDAIETVWDVRQAVRDRVVAEGHRPLVADEGGFAPPVDTVEDAFAYVEDAITTAGYVPNEDVALAVDVAASHFYDTDRGVYELESAGETLAPRHMIDHVVQWVEDYPIVSVEDPLDEDDWEAWERLASRLPENIQLLGDDLLVTNLQRLDRAVEEGAASAVLIKPDQAGTFTRTFEVVERAKASGVAPVVSARSGETCDNTIADIAVGLNAGQIKIGSLARSERLAKYNRLLEIETTAGLELSSLQFGL